MNSNVLKHCVSKQRIRLFLEEGACTEMFFPPPAALGLHVIQKIELRAREMKACLLPAIPSAVLPLLGKSSIHVYDTQQRVLMAEHSPSHPHTQQSSQGNSTLKSHFSAGITTILTSRLTDFLCCLGIQVTRNIPMASSFPRSTLWG